MIPTNQTTYIKAVSGNATTSLHDPNVTGNDITFVMGIAMQQEKDLSDTIVYCGTDPIAFNYGKDYPYVPMWYECSDEVLSISKTGNDEAFVVVSAIHDIPIYENQVYTTSSPAIVNGFTQGDIVIGLFLFFIMVMMFFSGIIRIAVGVKQKRSASNEYMGNNSEEGKVIYYD